MAESLANLGNVTRRQERKWRRRCLFLLPVLLPAATGAMGYEHLYWFLYGNHILAHEVRRDATVDFGGSQWRLAAIGTRSDVKPERIPQGFSLVVVDLSAKVGTARNALKVGDIVFEQLWGACKIGLTDMQGRRWDAMSLGYTPALYPQGNKQIDTCGSHSQTMPPPEAVITIRETFLVPNAVADSVRPTVRLAGEEPYYLLFDRPEAN